MSGDSTGLTSASRGPDERPRRVGASGPTTLARRSRSPRARRDQSRSASVRSQRGGGATVRSGPASTGCGIREPGARDRGDVSGRARAGSGRRACITGRGTGWRGRRSLRSRASSAPRLAPAGVAAPRACRADASPASDCCVTIRAVRALRPAARSTGDARIRAAIRPRAQRQPLSDVPGRGRAAAGGRGARCAVSGSTRTSSGRSIGTSMPGER